MRLFLFWAFGIEEAPLTSTGRKMRPHGGYMAQEKNIETTANLPVDVRQAVKTIKNAILQSQYRAAKGVNREQLSLYFGIGRYIGTF